MQSFRGAVCLLFAFAAYTVALPSCHAQAALLLEEPYGFFGTLNPTGHTALYFQNICAETPVKLRHCEPGENGSVIARYQGMSHYDWIAVPLIPYLYSTDDLASAPRRADRKTVHNLREKYYEKYMLPTFGPKLHAGSFVQGGYSQLIGVSFDRRIYAFRFDTTTQQDDAMIDELNDEANHSHFNLFYNNCADFARGVMNSYFPHAFGRNFFPDAGMTTPRQITYKLVRLSRKHPEMQLTVFDIAQVPGSRRMSHANKSVAQSLTTTAYAIPILIANPYVAGGLLIDYLIKGRHDPVPKDIEPVEADNLSTLTEPRPVAENHGNSGFQAAGIVALDGPGKQAGGSH